MENKTMTDIDPRIARQKTNSTQDTAIREKLNALVSTDFSKHMVGSLRNELEVFFTKSFENITDSQYIRKSYNELLPKLTDISNALITKGEENIKKVSMEKGVIMVTNHLGLGILTIINNENGNYPVSLPEFAGFPVRVSALKLISDKLDKPLFETAIELPEPLSTIQKATPTIVVPIDGSGRTKHLIEKTKEVITQNPGVIIIMYPEGGTSGKRNDGSPYDMDVFHLGAFVVASELNLSILPVCQVLNPEKGLELHILSPRKIEINTPENIREIMEQTNIDMQKDLNDYQSK